MNFRQILVMLCIVISGCAASNKYNIQKFNIEERNNLSRLQLNMQIEEDKIYIVDIMKDPSVATHFNYVREVKVPAGTNTTAAGAAGTAANLMTQVVFTESHKKKLHKAANKKANSIRDLYSKVRLLSLLKETLLKESLSQNKLAIVEQQVAEKEGKKLYLLKSQPEIRFSNNLTCLKMKLNVSILPAKYRDPVYKNTFEFWSPLVGPKLSESERCALWTNSDGKLIEDFIKRSCKEVMDMLAYDLQAFQISENQESKRFKTQKIYNEIGYYYIRGYPLKTSGDRVWIKDLRGNIRSYNGTLTALEGTIDAQKKQKKTHKHHKQ